MTKRKVTLLIVLMAVALAGIMALQLIWMKNALHVRNELFDRSVDEALNRTTNRMERLSDVFIDRFDLIYMDYHLLRHHQWSSTTQENLAKTWGSVPIMPRTMPILFTGMNTEQLPETGKPGTTSKFILPIRKTMFLRK